MSANSTLTVEQAAAAIRAMINASPRSPRQAEIEAIVGLAVAPPASMSLSALEADLLEAVLECQAAEKAFIEAGASKLSQQDYDDAEARWEAAVARMEELTDQLPAPARSITALVLRAHVALCYADRDRGGRLVGLSVEKDGAAHVAAFKLVTEVLQFAGVDFH